MFYIFRHDKLTFAWHLYQLGGDVSTVVKLWNMKIIALCNYFDNPVIWYKMKKNKLTFLVEILCVIY